MCEKPLISIIVPTYNRQNLIVCSIESILNQTYKNIEIIIINDGSTDGTKDVLKKIKDSRVRVFNNENNQGASASRNIGVNKAIGSFIAFQDSDDIWYQEKLEIQYKKLITSGADAVSCSFYRKDTKGIESLVPNTKIIDKITENNNIINLKQILRSNLISTQTLLIKKEVFKTLKGFDTNLKSLEDWELAIRLLKNHKIYFLSDPLLMVFLQKNSISLNTKEILRSRKKIIIKHLNTYIKNPKIFLLTTYDFIKLFLKKHKKYK